MSNKKSSELNDIDRKIRQALSIGMEDGTKLKIEFKVGFELFNTRRYHNYETWSGGYYITEYDTKTGEVLLTAESEDLDDAVNLWLSERKKLLTTE